MALLSIFTKRSDQIAVARYQQTISALLALGSIIGLFAFGRMMLVGKDVLAWAALALMFAIMWLARTMIVRMPLRAEAVMRLDAAPKWGDLSLARHHILFWTDWPLFLAIRDREAARLYNEPLIAAEFSASSVTLRPVEGQHLAPFFLERIATSTAGYGLKVGNWAEGLFARRLVDRHVRLEWHGADQRVWDYLSTTLAGVKPVSLKTFSDTLEAGYVSTLSDVQRSAFYASRR